MLLLFLQAKPAKTAKLYLCERRRREECTEWESPVGEPQELDDHLTIVYSYFNIKKFEFQISDMINLVIVTRTAKKVVHSKEKKKP